VGDSSKSIGSVWPKPTVNPSSWTYGTNTSGSNNAIGDIVSEIYLFFLLLIQKNNLK